MDRSLYYIIPTVNIDDEEEHAIKKQHEKNLPSTSNENSEPMCVDSDLSDSMKENDILRTPTRGLR